MLLKYNIASQTGTKISQKERKQISKALALLALSEGISIGRNYKVKKRIKKKKHKKRHHKHSCVMSEAEEKATEQEEKIVFVL